MTISMTGFTALEDVVENGTIILELKAVNSRYLDLHFKMDDTFRVLEAQIRALIKDKVGRGKVECKLYFLTQKGHEESEQVNKSVLRNLQQLSQSVETQFPNSAPLSVAEVLKWPGVLMQSTVDKDKVHMVAITLITQGLVDLNAARLREGEKLKAIILDRLHEVEAFVEKTKPLMGGLVKSYQERLLAKLHETISTVDESRITQEAVLYAQRIDVDEELSRLSTHILEVKRILEQQQPVGKRLDFMMQEMNREANTLGSKSVSIETTQTAMALKVLIEQMREQIQNIE